MSTDPRSEFPIEIIVVIIATIAAICVVVVVFKPPILPLFLKPTPTALQPSSTSEGSYQPDIIPAPTDTPDPASTSTFLPTQTLVPTFTPTLTNTPGNQPLPDLTVTGISDPVCLPDRTGSIVEFNIYVRNIGRASTRSFGAFDVSVFLILGERQYELDEWAEKFNGVIGTTNMGGSSLNPGKDSKLTVVLDLKANSQFGIKAVANSGANSIPESDTSNNTLIKYFSVYCY